MGHAVPAVCPAPPRPPPRRPHPHRPPLTSWDFGTGAGFYVDATVDKWCQYRMYSYVLRELPAVLRGLPELDVDRVRRGGRTGMASCGLSFPGAGSRALPPCAAVTACCMGGAHAVQHTHPCACTLP